MNIIDFPERNTVYAEYQSEYLPLPAHRVPNSPEGEVIACFGFSFWDRVKFLFTGRLWISVFTFNYSFPPLRPTVNKKDVMPADAAKVEGQSHKPYARSQEVQDTITVLDHVRNYGMNHHNLSYEEANRAAWEAVNASTPEEITNRAKEIKAQA